MRRADTVVLDDDLNRSSRRRRRRQGRPRRQHPARLLQGREKTAATFVDADGKRYAVSGDFAIGEEDGSMTLLGRGSVCINSGGEKIFPEEVEARLKAHPDVFDASSSACPTSAGASGSPPSCSPAPGHRRPSTDLDAHCRRHIAGYKVPASSTSSTRSSAPRPASPTTPGRSPRTAAQRPRYL